MRVRHLLFDLDGTLIDSAPSILECYRLVLDQFELEPQLPLENSLIGPPLSMTLRLISGISDENKILEMMEKFKSIYDTHGFTHSIPYLGIDDLLRYLNENGYKLFIVTNKRVYPTRKILDFLNWSSYFDGVYAQDAFNPFLPSKPAVIERVLDMHSIPKLDALYVGDRIEDGEAAHANGLKFIWVAWGYGIPSHTNNHFFDYEVVDSPSELNNSLSR
jgi:phosphoglycolate phosphatase